ncbi:Serralysin-like metalloprotease C-terminal [Trinorchestia longiramus]|nr:Serralysin-like metalloprotease C-terminal [Trinorchestia longiramus]
MTDPGDDKVMTDPGDDKVMTDPGDDKVMTDPGDDEVMTDPGDDKVMTDPGDNKVMTHAGDNKVMTHAGDDKVMTDRDNKMMTYPGRGEFFGRVEREGNYKASVQMICITKLTTVFIFEALISTTKFFKPFSYCCFIFCAFFPCLIDVYSSLNSIVAKLELMQEK